MAKRKLTVKLVNDGSGMRYEVVGGGSGCHDGTNQRLLEIFGNLPVVGFGGAETEATGQTQEYWDTKHEKRTVKPLPVEEKENPFGDAGTEVGDAEGPSRTPQGIGGGFGDT